MSNRRSNKTRKDDFELEVEELVFDDDDEIIAPEDVKKKNNKRKKWPVVLTVIIGILLIIIVVAAIAINSILGGLKRVKIDKDDLGVVEVTTEAGADKDEINKINNIVNIAMFGVDTRDVSAEFGDQFRSDSIIVLSIDPVNNELKITSILRDTKVPIDGYDPQKINAAYKYGGAPLAIKTLNQNFRLNIENYVSVDFGNLAEVIDILGGVDIDVDEDEAANMALTCPEKPVTAGFIHLDGDQAVAYSRIRKVDSDYYRASRQQEVLTALFNKVKGLSPTQYPTLVKQFLGCVETSLSYTDIMSYVTSINLSSAKLVKNTIPDPEFEDGLWGGIDETGSWVWVYDLEKAADRLHKIIYGEK